MKFPYSQVHVHDGIAFAARSGRIESFNLHSGGHLSTWVHPDTQSFVDSIKSFHTENTDDASTTEPPSKRQKTLEDNEGAGSASRTEERAQDEVKVEGPGKKAQKQPRPRKADRPVIIQITGTTDGKHIVAVSGHDKAIWVFEHAGTGQLRQLSKR